MHRRSIHPPRLNGLRLVFRVGEYYYIGRQIPVFPHTEGLQDAETYTIAENE